MDLSTLIPLLPVIVVAVVAVIGFMVDHVERRQRKNQETLQRILDQQRYGLGNSPSFVVMDEPMIQSTENHVPEEDLDFDYHNSVYVPRKRRVEVVETNFCAYCGRGEKEKNISGHTVCNRCGAPWTPGQSVISRKDR